MKAPGFLFATVLLLITFFCHGQTTVRKKTSLDDGKANDLMKVYDEISKTYLNGN